MKLRAPAPIGISAMKFIGTAAVFIHVLLLGACAGPTLETIPLAPSPFVEAGLTVVPTTPLPTVVEGHFRSDDQKPPDKPTPLPPPLISPPITSPPVEPTPILLAIATPAMNPNLPHEVTIEELPDGSYVCRPPGEGPFAAVLYNHGGLGTIVGGDLAGTCRSLAEAGYLARSEKRQETRQLTGHLTEVLEGLKRLRSHPDADASRIGMMGFSRGGLLTLQAAISQPEYIHAVVLMAPARGKSAMERTLRSVSRIDDPVRVLVSENDQTQANHVQISHEVADTLRMADKDVDLTIYPPYGDDGHKLFFLVQEPYWSDLIAFFDKVFDQR